MAQRKRREQIQTNQSQHPQASLSTPLDHTLASPTTQTRKAPLPISAAASIPQAKKLLWTFFFQSDQRSRVDWIGQIICSLSEEKRPIQPSLSTVPGEIITQCVKQL
jgi:hypothetical protein